MSEISHVTVSNTVQMRLILLHDTNGFSFREIQAMEEFYGIPVRTLHAIYTGQREVPKKFRARFHLPHLVEVETCPEHGVVHQYHCDTEAVYSLETQVVHKKPRPRQPRVPRNYPGKVWVF